MRLLLPRETENAVCRAVLGCNVKAKPANPGRRNSAFHAFIQSFPINRILVTCLVLGARRTSGEYHWVSALLDPYVIWGEGSNQQTVTSRVCRMVMEEGEGNEPV